MRAAKAHMKEALNYMVADLLLLSGCAKEWRANG
jgi:hypothetical protein